MTSTDQTNKLVEIPTPPLRIISLVPSQTELLYDLGLEEEVLGITKFCVHPTEWFKSKQRIGGTKDISMEKIQALNPDLIIGNKEENQKEQVEALMLDYPVWMSDIKNLEDSLEMIIQIGKLTNREKKAIALVEEIQLAFSALKSQLTTKPKKRVAYFIWKAPYMVAAGDTFIDNMLDIAGFSNVFGHLERYPAIDLETLANSQPALIFLSSEPYPFKEKHFETFQEACPNAKIILVDGECFSWYGSRLLYTARYFEALHTQIW